MEYLGFIITTACNMNCGFCLRSEDPDFLDLRLAKKILKQARELGYIRIGITGGEPYMHPKFMDLINAIVDEGLGFTIVSNGLHYEKYKPLLKYKKKFVGITFSLDAGTEKVHDMLRGEGSFKKVCKAIRFFVGKGIRVRTQICLSKFNKNEIEKFVKLSERLRVWQCRFLSVIPDGINSTFVLSDIEKRECIIQIKELRKRKFIPLLIMSSLCTNSGVNFCPALELTDMAVNPKGQLIFCCDTVGDGAVLGDLRKESLKKLIEKGKKVSMFLKQKRKEHYEKNEFFEGFNTCKFCNYYLNCFKN